MSLVKKYVWIKRLLVTSNLIWLLVFTITWIFMSNYEYKLSEAERRRKMYEELYLRANGNVIKANEMMASAFYMGGKK